MLLHVNDTHAHLEPWTLKVGASDSIGGFARLATEIARLRKKFPHALLLHGGDVFQGTIFFNKYGGIADRDCFEPMGFSAEVLGNHEFDRGPAGLEPYAHAVTWPLLSANVTAPDSVLWFSRHVQPYIVLDVPGDNGVMQKVGVIGLTTPEAAQLATLPAGWRVANPESVARVCVAELEAKGVTEIVALTHLGISADSALAQHVRGIDVIVGGHSHTPLDPYPTRLYAPDHAPVWIVQAGSWGSHLGELHLRFRAGVAETAWGALHPITQSIRPDSAVHAIVTRYALGVKAERDSIVGTLPIALYGGVDSLRKRECTLGNLTADAMLHAVAGKHIDIAIGNSGGIRQGFAKGPVTLSALEEAFPFDNVVVTCTTTGALIKADLEQAVERWQEGRGRFPILSGLRMTWDPERSRMHRILKLEWWDDDDYEWEPLYDDKSLGVAVNDFMAQGGDGYRMAGDHWVSTGIALRDAFAAILADPKALDHARPSGRLRTP